MPNLYFLLCGHGRLDVTSKKEVQYMQKERTNVITLAPPGGTCSYSPDGLMELKDLSVDYLNKKRKSSKDTSLASFWRRIKQYQRKQLGSEYCGDWIQYYANKYSPFKACGLQDRIIHHKFIHFDDDDSELKKAIGVWDLQTGTNHIQKLSKELTSFFYDELDFKLEDIIDTLHRKFPGNTINILDCTCSALYDANGEIIMGAPLKSLQSKLDKQYIKLANEALHTPRDASPFTPDSTSSVKKAKSRKAPAVKAAEEVTAEETPPAKARRRATKKAEESPPAAKSTSRGAKTAKVTLDDYAVGSVTSGVKARSYSRKKAPEYEEEGPFTSGVKAKSYSRKKTPELEEEEEEGPFTSRVKAKPTRK